MSWIRFRSARSHGIPGRWHELARRRERVLAMTCGFAATENAHVETEERLPADESQVCSRCLAMQRGRQTRCVYRASDDRRGQGGLLA